MKVTKIIHCGSGYEEADVEVTDGNFSVICFCHPCELQGGQELTMPIHTLDATHIMRISQETYSVDKLHEPFSYHLIGQLIDRANGIVAIGGLLIDAGINIPKDILQGEFIEFRCDRLDIY